MKAVSTNTESVFLKAAIAKGTLQNMKSHKSNSKQTFSI